MADGMTPERWQVVKDVFQAALRRDERQRPAYLDHACAGDPSLRADVDAMLASDERAGSFLEEPVIDRAPELVAEEVHTSRVGSTIGHYRVLSPLGAGGMGEVYRAEDSRLGRQVALKVLLPGLVSNIASRARFFREARLAASLDHPNICTIYEVGEAGDVPFISMQYVDGDTLQHVLDARPLGVDRLLSIALQVADALGVAHAAGIVHRDIKSSNIMVTPSDQAKVLDFGISRVLQPGSETDAPSSTSSGVFFGTPSYMAPEQARGEPADSRSDIFAFGTVLYEMASGRVPFSRPSAPETTNAVINDPHTPVREINPQIPPPLANLIDRALAKDPAHRYQSIEDVRVVLRSMAQAAHVVGSSPEESRLSPSRRRLAALPATLRRGRRLHTARRRGIAAAAAAIILVAANQRRTDPAHQWYGIVRFGCRASIRPRKHAGRSRVPRGRNRRECHGSSVAAVTGTRDGPDHDVHLPGPRHRPQSGRTRARGESGSDRGGAPGRQQDRRPARARRRERWRATLGAASTTDRSQSSLRCQETSRRRSPVSCTCG